MIAPAVLLSKSKQARVADEGWSVKGGVAARNLFALKGHDFSRADKADKVNGL
jgi:hypothetical protein